METSPFLTKSAQKEWKREIEKGRVEEARALVARQGARNSARNPTKKQSAILASITEVTRLEIACRSTLVVDSWGDLLSGL